MTLKEVQKLVNNLSPEERELINDQYHSFKELYEILKKTTLGNKDLKNSK